MKKEQSLARPAELTCNPISYCTGTSPVLANFFLTSSSSLRSHLSATRTTLTPAQCSTISSIHYILRSRVCAEMMGGESELGGRSEQIERATAIQEKRRTLLSTFSKLTGLSAYSFNNKHICAGSVPALSLHTRSFAPKPTSRPRDSQKNKA